MSKVQFYRDSTLLGTDSISPYTYTMANLAAGSYRIIVKATDDKGLANSSASIAVLVLDATNKAPIVSIINLANGAIFTSPATINMEATVEDADGTINNVDFTMEQHYY